MNSPEDNIWNNLLAASRPAFVAADATPPFGFTTRMLAQLRAEEGQVRQMERIGWRALFASLVILLVTFAAKMEIKHEARAQGDFDPGVRSLIVGADASLS